VARGLWHLLACAHLGQIIGGAGRRRLRFAIFIQQSANLLVAESRDPRFDLAQRQITLFQLPDQL